MDGRNAGGSNPGRPKLIRSGLSAASGPSIPGQDTQAQSNPTEDNISKEAFLESIPLPPTQKPFASEVSSSDLIKAVQKPLGTVISSTQNTEPSPAKSPVAVVPSGMSEGLSLVSYSSSSSEASASEDNDQDDLNPSSASEKTSVLGDQVAESLVQKMKDIADSQEKLIVSSKDGNETSLPSESKQLLPAEDEPNTADESEAKVIDTEITGSLAAAQAAEKMEFQFQEPQLPDDIFGNNEMSLDEQSLSTEGGQSKETDTHVTAVEESEIDTEKELTAVSEDTSGAVEEFSSASQSEEQLSARLPSSESQREPDMSAPLQVQLDPPSKNELVKIQPQLPLNTEGVSSEMSDDGSALAALPLHTENIDESLQSAARELQGLEENDMMLDPIEEQLKLLTEGLPLSALGIEGEESVMQSEPENPPVVSAEGNLLGVQDEQPVATEVPPTVDSENQSEVPLTSDFTDSISGGTTEDKEEKVQDMKETPVQSVDVSESPMKTESTDVAESEIPASEPDTSSGINVSSTLKETKSGSQMAIECEVLSDPRGNKRTYDDSENVEHVHEEPKEKRMRHDEADDALSASKNGSADDSASALEEKSEIMETESVASEKGLPTFEKLSEELKATGKLNMEEEGRSEVPDSGIEEESKTEMDDSCMDSPLPKDGKVVKDKDDDKEAATPSSKKKRKKKSYERPRGEGGKFRKERPDPSLLDEETRMEGTLPQDEDSQGSVSKREVRRFRCEVIVPESTEVFTADKVVEYVWPLEGCGEHYFIQEQISQYLGIMSFKRKYPDLRRRPLEMQERDYLKEKGLVSEMACDLGLTAVRSEDVLDVMLTDFPSKFEELQRLLRERKENEIKERGKVTYSMATLDKSKMQEYLKKAAEDSARWNAIFNKEKREERRYNFDLQTFTLQMPGGRHRVFPPEMTKMGAYPVAVLPGQYTDYYREYAPTDLKTMPLNTVMSAPMVNDQLGSDGAGSDSEEETSALPSTDTTDTIEIKDEKIEGLPRCKVCNGTKNRNKGGKPEPLIICAKCRSASHPTCIELTLVMVPKIESYNWQCMDCKSCVTCNDPDDEDKMIFCDMCDRGYHIYCVGLRRVPNGRWHCKECAICSSCGSKTPAGIENCKNAEWQHEFKKDKNNKQLRYATTLCVPCDKYWKRRQFCYVCLKVYRSIPEDGMVRCSNCPKYIHREGCSTMYENERFCNNCFKIRNSTALNHSRIIAAAKKKMASGY